MCFEVFHRLISTVSVLICFSPPLVTFVLSFSVATVWDCRMAKRLLGGDHFLLYQAESPTKCSRSLSSKSQRQACASTRASLKFRGWTEVKSGNSRAGLYHKRAKRRVWRLLEGTAIVPPMLHNCKLQQIAVRHERKANEIPKGRRSKTWLKMEKARKIRND